MGSVHTFTIPSSTGRSYTHRLIYHEGGGGHKSSKELGGTTSQPHRKKFSFHCHWMLIFLVLNLRVISMFTETGLELPGHPIQTCPSGSFLFWGGVVGRGWIVLYTIVCERDIPKGHSGLGVLGEPYSAKPASGEQPYRQPGYIGVGHGSSLCRLAGLYGNSAERG